MIRTTSQAKTISNRFSRKISIGNRSLRFRLRRDWRCLLWRARPGRSAYTIRVKAPSGVKLMPHRHPEDRIYTVISGVFYIGLGDRFATGDLKAYRPGCVIVLPRDTWHFHWAKSGEYITQVIAIGPLGTWNTKRSSR